MRKENIVRGCADVSMSHLHIYIIYTPNLGSETALPERGREQGRFRGCIEGARGSIERLLKKKLLEILPQTGDCI